MPTRPGDDGLLNSQRRGNTLLSVIWNELDRCIDVLMHGSPDLFPFEDARLKGRAEGVAWCIAVLTQSPRPIDINAVKAEAMERWESRNEATP